MTKDKKKNIKKMKNEDLVAISLRLFASTMIANPENFSEEQGKILDRALRSCKGISDIYVVWVSWRHCAEQRNWLTDNEMNFGKQGYFYIDQEE